MSLPPGPRIPGVLQTLAYIYEPFMLFTEALRRYGDPFTLRLPGFGNFVMLTAPELIKQVFTGDPQALHASHGNEVMRPVVGSSSLMLLDGKAHLRQRRLLLPPFHGERMHAYAGLMAELAEREVTRMPRGQPFALHAHMQWVTLQVILRAVFGLDQGAELERGVELLVDFMTPPAQFIIFIPRSALPYFDFPLSPYRKFMQKREQVDQMLYGIIRARRAATAQTRTDVLSLLLAVRDEDGKPMSEEELRDELLTLLAAGHETTATTLAWTFLFILRHPQVEARLRAELAGASQPGGQIDVAALVASEYLEAVIKESMRLRPIVPVVARRVEQPMKIAGYDIQAGTFLAPCVYLAHRRPESWPEPEVFRPERFLGAKADPYTWFPFGGGIRRCLGMAFAMYEMKIILGVTLLRTRLQLTRDHGVRSVRRGMMLAPTGGPPVIRAS